MARLSAYPDRLGHEDTSLADALPAGEKAVWTGAPHTPRGPGAALVSLALDVVILGGFLWSARLLGPPESTAVVARTRYHLTGSPAVVADGKTVQTIELGASPLLRYVAGGKRVTATFGPSGRRAANGPRRPRRTR